MVDLEYLKTKGVSKEKLRELFTAESPSEKVKSLKDLCCERIKTGLRKNIDEAKAWWIIDRAYDSQFHQASYSLFQNLIGKKLNQESLKGLLDDWGLGAAVREYCPSCQMFTPCNGGCSYQPKEYRADIPTFQDVVVPVVQAYVKIRWATIFNDRDLIPHYKFEPLKLTLKDKLRADIITDRADRMATEFDYRSDRRQKILQTLIYATCLQFPMEEWYEEKQMVTDEDGKHKEVTVKEGLRNTFPHPSKFFWDDNYRLSTINSDTGCTYVGYWHAERFGDIRRNKSYFNVDKIKRTNPSQWANKFNSYLELYPCAMSFPPKTDATSKTEREDKAVYYGTGEGTGAANDDNYAVIVCEKFAKLVPKDWGLGDYEYPVWFRLVMASEDTVIYAAPLPYCPASFYGYDYDGNRARNPSLALEIMPFETVISNYLSQLLLTIRNNLQRVIFYNTDFVEDQMISNLSKIGRRLFEGPQFVPYSGRKQAFAQGQINDAFAQPVFNPQNTGEIMAAVNLVINIMERVLQFSSQELGVAAAHEQSATETHIIAGHQDTRLKFTGSFIDDGEYSDKVRIYKAIMAYSSDEIFAQIGELNEQSRKALKELGFTVEDEEVPGKAKAGIKGNKKTLMLQNFASTREAANRLNNPQIAQSLAQLIDRFMSIPALLEEVGVQQVVDWYNDIARWFGVPNDFKIKITSGAEHKKQAEEARAQLQDVIAKVSQQQVTQLAATLGKEVVQPMREQLVTLGQAIGELAQRQVASDQKDGVQDQAILRIVATMRDMATAVAQNPPVPEPEPPLFAEEVPVESEPTYAPLGVS